MDKGVSKGSITESRMSVVQVVELTVGDTVRVVGILCVWYRDESQGRSVKGRVNESD